MAKNKEKFYCQCDLARPTDEGRQLMVSWIPEEIAKVGATVRLKDENGTWTEGWLVLAVYGRRPLSYLREHDRDYINQRKQSDV